LTFFRQICRKKVNVPPALTQKTIDFCSTHFFTSLQDDRQDSKTIHQDDRRDNGKN
jgi:hypothetical protein